MKRTVSALLVAAMLLLMMPIMIVSAAPSGQAVASAQDFKNMNATGTYYLAADITITEAYGKNFYGTLDGNGHSITVNGPTYVFPIVAGTVKNLTVKGNITLTSDGEAAGIALSAGSAAVGGLTATFENVTSKVNITASGYSGQTCPIGGIVSKMNKGTVSFINCKNEGNITIDAIASTNIGGILGYASGADKVTFTSCVNEGSVSCKEVKTDFGIGGLAGCVEARDYGTRAFALELTGCQNKGQVSTNSNSHVGIGGLVGFVTNRNSSKATTNIKNCDNLGKISSSTTATSLDMGGMIGRAFSMPHLYMEKCTNSGELDNHISSSWSATGGMVGNFMTISGSFSNSCVDSSTATFKECVNNAVIRGMEAGGIIGAGMQLGSENISVAVDSCVNVGSIYANDYAGGIVGAIGLHNSEKFAAASFKSCYNAGYVRGMASTAGILGYMGGAGTNASKQTLFDSCVNIGTIKCKYVGEWPLETFGSGIVAQIERNVTVTGCVNTGSIQGPVAAVNNTVPMAPKTTKTVTASGNFCLDVYYAKEAYATKKNSASEIAASITSDILAIDDSALWAAFDAMDGLRGENYTKASWDDLVAACNTGADILDPAKTPFTRMKQKDVNNAADNMMLKKGLLETYVAN